MFQRGKMNIKAIAQSFWWLLLLATSLNEPAIAEYNSWEECSKSEVGGLEKLYKLKMEGHDLRSLMSENNTRELSTDEEYMIYLLENKNPKEMAIVLTAKCAMKYPDSSPFSKEDIEKMENASDEAMRKLILQNKEYSIEK